MLRLSTQPHLGHSIWTQCQLGASDWVQKHFSGDIPLLRAVKIAQLPVCSGAGSTGSWPQGQSHIVGTHGDSTDPHWPHF